jgi:archaemetzincin
MKPYFLLLIVLLFAFKTTKAIDNTKTIYIQPFGNFSDSSLHVIVKELHKVFKNIEVKKSIDLPNHSYYKPRNRYRADILIKYLNDITKSNSYIIGFTNKDISTTKNNVKDWGVMGLGYCPGKSCIVSSYRIHGNLDKLLKLSLHELGHNAGLPHCPNKTCYMKDAEGKDNLNNEKSFCNKCRNYLLQNKWTLNN